MYTDNMEALREDTSGRDRHSCTWVTKWAGAEIHLLLVLPTRSLGKGSR